MASSYCAEAIVIGSGPAGLGAALGLARSGIDVVVLEQQDRLGSLRRGETIRFNQDMEDLLGQGFFEKQVIQKIRKRTYVSHTGKSQVNREIRNPNNIINWQDFIQAMAEVVVSAGARVWTGSTVTDILRDGDAVCGVRSTVQGFVEEELRAKAVFSCGGCDDPASRLLNLDRSHIDMPVFKQLLSGYTGPSDRLEYYFHLGGGGLTIGTIFPRGGEETEIILLNALKTGTSQPSFDEFKDEHPRFRQRLDGAMPFYTLKTKIPMGGMLTPACALPGLVMAGDALGHVQARGGSGIMTSFLIGFASGQLGAQAIRSTRWTKDVSDRLNREIHRSPHMRSLRKHNLIYSRLRMQIFGRIRTPEDMDRYWPFLKVALR
ncbi:MAG TPA: FAD-dependent oxidoreductase [Deltaproteobacteria bacterium]|nr:FAD-dependent oxidoreductase [Deltaproteobacteria bacterium]HPJ92783.1 FAD-dependent oxidoreductase [Deltaproteobacteria bacterium]HPR50778.1 FAD-dependent oxidoreductase [Deltaproteobacteria bacterium]